MYILCTNTDNKTITILLNENLGADYSSDLRRLMRGYIKILIILLKKIC